MRTVTEAESIIVKVTTDCGITGVGEAVPTHVITGESIASIQYAIENILSPVIKGKSILNREALFEIVNNVLVGNWGYSKRIKIDFTISVNNPDEMVKDATTYLQNGFSILKIKVGTDSIDKEWNELLLLGNRLEQK